MKVNDFECNALCDLGSSISIMPKKLYYALDLGPLQDCDLNVNFLDATSHTHLGKIDDVLILVNGNYVPVDFIVMDLDFKLPCPIVLGRPFLRTVGAIIDMRVGNIKFQFPLKKGMEHLPRKRIKKPFYSIGKPKSGFELGTIDQT